MSIFCYKNLETNQHLGEELKAKRQQKGYTIEQVVQLSHIPLKYLCAIEDCRIDSLPNGHAHLKAYLHKLCDLYEMNFEQTLYKFRCEGGFKNPQSHLLKNSQKHLRPNFLLARNLSLVVFILFFISYLGFQIHGITTPPKLIVYTPIEGQISNRTEITVQGLTDKEAHLEANGQEIKVGEDGHFNTNILLANGVNTITLSTTKKHGKTTTVIRHVVVNDKEAKKVSVKDLGNEAR
jgi:cytoskeletal protein RodZ